MKQYVHNNLIGHIFWHRLKELIVALIAIGGTGRRLSQPETRPLFETLTPSLILDLFQRIFLVFIIFYFFKCLICILFLSHESITYVCTRQESSLSFLVCSLSQGCVWPHFFYCSFGALCQYSHKRSHAANTSSLASVGSSWYHPASRRQVSLCFPGIFLGSVHHGWLQERPSLHPRQQSHPPAACGQRMSWTPHSGSQAAESAGEVHLRADQSRSAVRNRVASVHGDSWRPAMHAWLLWWQLVLHG